MKRIIVLRVDFRQSYHFEAGYSMPRPAAFVVLAFDLPTTYKGKAFTWTQGRKLASGSMNGNTFAYDYDGNGMRYEKTVNGKKTEYYWNGTQLLFEYRQELGERVYYIYDASGVAGLLYKNNVYYFAKNAFGDIVGIFNRAGQQVAEYAYDAWGNIIYENYDYSNNIGEINPFRYRGYYYDTETGFYYLQTRYYDPETMRFINADNYELVGALSCVPGQLNLYAYANNNPIMYTDETGEAFFTSLLIGVLIGAAIGGVIGGVSASMKGENVVGGILSGALVGGVLGAATIVGGATALAIGGKSVAGFVAVSTFAGKGALLATTVGVTVASSFAAGVGSYTIETHYNNRQFNWNEAIRSGGNTMLKGLTNYGIGMAMGAAGSYNYLLSGTSRRSVGKMISDGVRNGLASNALRILQESWYYFF